MNCNAPSNLLVFSGFWPDKENGISGIFVVQQVAALVKAGFSVTVVVPEVVFRPRAALLNVDDLGLDPSRVKVVRACVMRLPEGLSFLPGMFLLNSFLYGLWLMRAFRSLKSAGNEFCGCIIHEIRYAALSFPLWKKFIFGKTVIVVHGVDPKLDSPLPRGVVRLFESAGAASDTVVLVGNKLKDYSRSLGFPLEKTLVLANGTDIPDFEEVSFVSCAEGRPVRILSVSNLTPIKGIDDNLRALAVIASSRPQLSWEYHIVGDGVCRNELESLAARLGLSDRVFFMGRLDYAETMNEMARSDIFSLPSWGEAFGIVYLEAMARKRPVIGCLENGAADIISHEQDGLLVSPRSVPELIVALERLISDPQLRHRLGVAARLTAENFTWEKNSRHLLFLLGLSIEGAS